MDCCLSPEMSRGVATRLARVRAPRVWVFALALACSGFGADVNSAFFGGLEWRGIGPNRGGRSIAAAGSSARIHEYYFGATGGGLWKTTNGGTTWRPVTDGQIKSA